MLSMNEREESSKPSQPDWIPEAPPEEGSHYKYCSITIDARTTVYAVACTAQSTSLTTAADSGYLTGSASF
jgi:hypothetical protein